MSRTTSFELTRIPRIIHAAWFEISGTATLGESECEWGGPYPWPMDFYASMMDSSTGGYWLASSPLPWESGKFVFTWKFDPAPPSTTTWEFLMDGRAEITLSGHPSYLLDLCRPTTDPPRGVIDKAVLVIDGDFPVPTGSETWGRIKALYMSTE